jgi:3-oxoisoapionate decarboxylase
MHDTVQVNRREAMRLLSGAVAFGLSGAGAAAADAENTTTGVGLVIYTLGIRRRVLRAGDSQRDLFEPFTFLEECRRLGAGGMQIPLGALDAEQCARLRDRAEAWGMYIEGIIEPPFSDSEIERFAAAIRAAREAGAKAVRTVILPGRRYEQFSSLDEYRRFAERGRLALKRAAPVVERYRVPLAVENHKDQRLDERLALLRELDSAYIGACVDLGNSFALLEDPLAVVEALAPLAFSVHLKDQAVQEYGDGFLLADVALGDGFLDLKRMVDVLRDAKPDIRFTLETITRDPLRVPCLAESYWATFPTVPGADLAHALRTVRAQAAAELPTVNNLELAKQAKLELDAVHRSLQYARNTLGL